jgi:NAD-dependent deacetylase
MSFTDLEGLPQVVDLLVQAEVVIALTGAGISVESGIPAFRGAQGLWDRYDPMEYAHINAFRINPDRVWKMLSELRSIIERARPNSAHLALVELERLGRLKAIITQNVDSLHQMAGSTNVIEIHGSGKSLICLECRRRFKREDVDLEDLPPRCSCQGVLKPEVVFFGEPIPQEALERAVRAVSSCDLMLVIGTSAQVAPACLIPEFAVQAGATVVEINVESTELTGSVANQTLIGPADQVLAVVIEEVGVALKS